MATTIPSPAASAIEPDALYRLPEFQRITGLGRYAMRTARRNGLRVIYSGGRAWIKGGDFIDYLSKTGGDET